MDAKHNYTSNDLENAMLVADENMVRQHTPPPINDEPAWKTRGKILAARYDRDQGRNKLKDKRSRGKAYDKKGKGGGYVLGKSCAPLRHHGAAFPPHATAHAHDHQHTPHTTSHGHRQPRSEIIRAAACGEREGPLSVAPS